MVIIACSTGTRGAGRNLLKEAYKEAAKRRQRPENEDQPIFGKSPDDQGRYGIYNLVSDVYCELNPYNFA